MKQLVLGLIIGSLLTAAPTLAFHYFGHNPAQDEMERMQQWQERQQQEQFRNEQRQRSFLNPC